MRVPRWAIRAGKALATVSVVVGIVLLPLTFWQAAEFASKKGWLWRAVGIGGRRVFAVLLRTGPQLSVVLVLAGAGLFGFLIVQDKRWRKLGAQTPLERGETPPGPKAPKPEKRPLLKAKGANDNHFPRVESAKDSFGNEAHELSPGSERFWADTGRVLRPGQQVTFELEATDPNGEDLELNVISPAGVKADVAISDGLVTWNVREEDISDPAYLHVYVMSQRDYHRVGTYDATASFVYRVLPRL